MKKDLKDKEQVIAAQEKDREKLMEVFEKKVEDTRRETREKVQKVMEKRIAKLEKAKSPEVTTSKAVRKNAASLTARVNEERRIVPVEVETEDNKIGKRMSSASVKRTRNQETPSFNSLGMKQKSLSKPPAPDTLETVPAPQVLRETIQEQSEVTFNKLDDVIER